jgi:Amt family ammonium transporter
MEQLTTNNVWMMVCTALVFIMHLGFSTLEIGLARSKNTVNILFKNVFIISIGILIYSIGGFNLMYPGEFLWDGFIGFAGFGLEAPMADGSLDLAYNAGYTYWTDFLFQAMFAATAATIVSGAIAERAKLESFFIFSILLVGIIYPIVGSWKWGGGWLDEAGFYDFAGSTLVHSVGGWAALVYITLLGARLGKYNGQVKPLEGHSIPMAAIGVFLLWLGWFGFNGGSVLSADPGATSFTLVTTCLAAAAGAISAIVFARIVSKSFDVTMGLNGILAGLVGITAGADSVSVGASIIIGLIAGAIVVFGVNLMDRLKLDDPVGAVPVHLLNGIWGTLAVGIFAEDFSFLTQLKGVLAIGVFVVVLSYIILIILKKTMGLRVTEREEVEGLDIHEHKMNAYPDFINE